ncbi:MAG: hypothetical protein HQK53_09060, partial [Oligoflexia bacterium]|nr:hypothetical protein [Oligoflexia bacterium]
MQDIHCAVSNSKCLNIHVSDKNAKVEHNNSCKADRECKSGFCDPTGFCLEKKICVSPVKRGEECDPTDLEKNFCEDADRGFKCKELVDQ